MPQPPFWIRLRELLDIAAPEDTDWYSYNLCGRGIATRLRIGAGEANDVRSAMIELIV
jgi:hypothetical protein